MPSMNDVALETLRQLLCSLGDAIRKRVIEGRLSISAEALSSVASHSIADTIYEIDKFGEEAIREWFDGRWPASQPVEVVMEGPEEPLCFPRGTSRSDTKWKCLLDPIDGTRGIMYDKRSAWALAGIAPQRGEATSLSDIVVAAMTELPTTKQWRADQVSAIRGGGLVAKAVNVLDGTASALSLAPSIACNFRHGFAWMAKFFPEGRALTAQIEEQLWDELVGIGRDASPTVFDDQYICTGGAFYELLAGHDRMVADLRPLVLARLDLHSSLVCHPYDVVAALLLAEAGVVYEHPLGGFPDAPLDTTSGITWVAYANSALADLARPVLQRILRKTLLGDR
jgi:fructose-1,6-bisphosphatase/inositol monophosphatase family enzyme